MPDGPAQRTRRPVAHLLQRCFWLFVLLLALIAVAPFLPSTSQGRLLTNGINIFVVVMTADRLFGAAASYLMLGILWAYFYALVGYFYPQTFVIGGEPASPGFYDALYLSMTVLTSTGFGDITPLARQARAICMVQQVIGALFVAILIARLAGVYPPSRGESE